MIHEARYWERDLARIASELERRQEQRVWRKGSYAALERLIMLGFYSTRKLIEAHWADPKLKSEQVHLTTYPSLNKEMDWRWWPEVDEYFDLSHPSPRKQPLEFVCNQIIHSFVFTPAFRARQLSGIYFCSYERRDPVNRVELSEMVRVLRRTARGQPRLGGARFGPENNRFDEAQ